MLVVQSEDTIAAQATPPGRGGIGVVRVSGPLVSEIMLKVLGKRLSPRYADFCDFLADDKKIIDQGVAIYFPAPNSFTGEEVLELQGHGGQVVIDLLLQRVIELGARLANPGEFIQRAFLNHKIDLVQAEAVADLIDAASSQAAQNAMRSLQGTFSRQINTLITLLTEQRMYIEAAIDFTEEAEIERTININFKENLADILFQIKRLKDTAKQGIILREGMTAVIVGRPNAGKSSLFNCLSGQDKAIVTDIPGTTRDVLHSFIKIGDLSLHMLDTAGLHDRHDQSDPVEKEGIRRAWEEIKRADHILLVVDTSVDDPKDTNELCATFLSNISKQSRFTVLYNKIDVTGETARFEKINNVDCIYLSVKTQEGLEILKAHLKKSAGLHIIEDGFSARRRHLDALERAEKFLQDAQQRMSKVDSIELVAEELKQAQMVLGEITGEVSVDDILNKIFSEFCVGK